MVENILLFARSRRAPLEGAPEPVALGDLARDVARGFEPLARRAGATVRVNADDALMATADPAALRQILLNLLDNAAKYGPAGQTIAIDIARCGAAAQLRVSDGGPGVSAPDRERIWHPYVRLSGGPASRGGSGIGLSVVRELAESFGGRVWVEDADGGGARFVVEVQGA
jgi:signal transduction histidine kinase